MLEEAIGGNVSDSFCIIAIRKVNESRCIISVGMSDDA